MGTPYVTFARTGIKVDLKRYLSTKEGKEALQKIEKASKRFDVDKRCRNCGELLK